LTPLLSILRSLGALFIRLRPGAGRTTAWLPWLAMALVVAAALSPGTVTASKLVFQSSVAPTPVPPTPTPPPPPPATPTPPPPPPPTPTPVQPAPVPPTQAPVVTEAVPTQAPVPTQEQPIQPATSPTVVLILSPTPVSFPIQTPTLPPFLPTPTPQPSAGGNQQIVNWVKFWDTIAVILAYPWLCCGVGLMLLVPVALLFLEIKGRRPPPKPPEPTPQAMRKGETGDEGIGGAGSSSP
jgi:hypothetical protein